MSPGLFQVALQVPVDALGILEEGLHALELVQPPLRRVELRLAPGASTMLVVLGFDDSRCFTAQHTRVGALAMAMAAHLLDLENLSTDAAATFEARRNLLPLRASAEGDLSRVFAELHRHGPAPALRVAFDSEDELLAAWARHVAEGALWVPASRIVETEVFSVIFATPTGEYPDNRGTRVHRTPPPGKAGLWLELQPSPALSELLTRATQARREPRPARVAPRPIERFESDLDVRIDTLTDLAAQYASDISRGGLFVATDKPPALRARLRLHLTLPNGEVLTLPAEVVHRVMSGPRVGVGLQLIDLKPGTFAPIEALLNAEPVRRPRVLVVDDEAIWRSTLVRVLHALDCDITLAKDGREGLLKLIDGYFELDLVILDLHMPHLDGRGLIDRVRRLGGDAAFKMFLFSAASRDELQALGEPGLANGVFSKLDPLDVLATHLARELGRRWSSSAGAEAAAA
ncbi:MAG: response regulator [Archangium sp.]|nr:response regulator [Archangium sp.]